MYRDLHAAHERIAQLEGELERVRKLLRKLLSGGWLARVLGYKVYVDCEHASYCVSESPAGLASGAVKLHRRSNSTHCGPHPIMVKLHRRSNSTHCGPHPITVAELRAAEAIRAPEHLADGQSHQDFLKLMDQTDKIVEQAERRLTFDRR